MKHVRVWSWLGAFALLFACASQTPQDAGSGAKPDVAMSLDTGLSEPEATERSVPEVPNEHETLVLLRNQLRKRLLPSAFSTLDGWSFPQTDREPTVTVLTRAEEALVTQLLRWTVRSLLREQGRLRPLVRPLLAPPGPPVRQSRRDLVRALEQALVGSDKLRSALARGSLDENPNAIRTGELLGSLEEVLRTLQRAMAATDALREHRATAASCEHPRTPPTQLPEPVKPEEPDQQGERDDPQDAACLPPEEAWVLYVSTLVRDLEALAPPEFSSQLSLWLHGVTDPPVPTPLRSHSTN